MTLTYDGACQKLRASGLRITQPRMLLISALAANRRPLSIEALHTIVTPTVCDLVTVYRCLEAFESIGLVRRTFAYNGSSLYELRDGSGIWAHPRDGGKPIAIAGSHVAEAVRALAEITARLEARGYTQVTPLFQFFVDCPPAAAARSADLPETALRQSDEQTPPDVSRGGPSSVLVAQSFNE